MSVNVLHLSDIHFGRNYPCYGLKEHFEKHENIINGIIDVVSGLDDALKPEHIVFTGDIAWHGKTREYEEALEWFRRLLDAAHLTGRDISFCVGNHDVDLSCRCPVGELDDSSIAEIDELYQYKNIWKMEPRLYAYNTFCRELGVEPYSFPLHGRREYSYSAGYKDVAFPSGEKLRIVALNTAHLIAQGNISEDKMWLGREQLRTLRRYHVIPAGKDVIHTIALFHHGDRFLHPNETNSYDDREATLPMLMNHVNLAVSGHTESMGWPRLSRQFGGGTMLQGGAAYYNDDHMNSFCMIYISERTRKAGFIPYVYDGEWKDYDFGQMGMTDISKQVEEEGDLIENARIVFRAGDGESYEIRTAFLEVKTMDGKGGCHIRMTNRKAFFEPFLVDYSSGEECGGPFVLSLQESRKRSVGGQLAYMEYVDFVGRTKDCENKCVIVQDADGEVVFRTNDYGKAEERLFPPELLEKLSRIEKELDVRFRLPEAPGREELETVSCILARLFPDSEEGTPPEKRLSGSGKKQIELFGCVLWI